MRPDNFTHTPRPRPVYAANRFWHVGSRDVIIRAKFQINQFKGYRWPKITILHQVGTLILQHVILIVLLFFYILII